VRASVEARYEHVYGGIGQKCGELYGLFGTDFC